jgi:hypothetical protein
VSLTPRYGVSLAVDHGFSTGWRATAAFTIRFPGGPGPTFPYPCGDYWPDPDCDPWGPGGPWGPFLPFPFPLAGALHNQGLDHVLADIQSAAAAPPAQPRTREQLMALVDASAQRFFTARGLTIPGDDLYRWGRENAGAFNSVVTIPDFQRLSETQKRYLLETERILTHVPPRSVAPEVETLARKALRELNSVRAQPVLLGASIGSASFDYWSARGEAWRDAVGAYLETEPAALTVGGLAKVDFAAAVAGALRGAVTGAVAGPMGAVSGAVSGAVLMGTTISIGAALADALF